MFRSKISKCINKHAQNPIKNFVRTFYIILKMKITMLIKLIIENDK